MGGNIRKQMLWGLIFVGFVLSACGVGEKLREYGVRVKPAVNAPMELVNIIDPFFLATMSGTTIRASQRLDCTFAAMVFS